MSRSFNGTSDELDAGSPSLGVSTSYTISALVKTSVTTGSRVISGYRSTSSGNPILWQLDVNGTEARFIVRDDSGVIGIASKASSITSTSVWYHMVGVRDNGNTQVYVNAIAGVGDSDTFGTISCNLLLVGAVVSGSASRSAWWNGLIAEHAIWSVALSAEEIASLSIGQLASNVKPNDLVSYWRLFGRASPETDLVGNYNLTVTGTTVADHPRVFGKSTIVVGKFSGGATYNEFGSGGVVLGGSGSILSNYSPTISGGVSLGGAAAGIATYNPAAAGGITLGGQSSGIGDYVPAASGGVILGGTSAVSVVYVIAPSGGVVIGGSASPESQIYNESGSGGIIAGGTTTVTAIYTPSSAGGVSLGGVASSVLTCVVVGSGGVVTGGYGVITTPLQVVNLVYGRPLEITRITSVIPIRSLSIELSRITTIGVLQMSLTIPQVTKTTSDNLTYTFDLRRIAFLQNDPITGTPSVAQLSGTGSLTFTTPLVSGELVTVGIGGGTAGQTYRVGLLVTTVNGRTIDGLVDIRVVSRTSSG